MFNRNFVVSLEIISTETTKSISPRNLDINGVLAWHNLMRELFPYTYIGMRLVFAGCTMALWTGLGSSITNFEQV